MRLRTSRSTFLLSGRPRRAMTFQRRTRTARRQRQYGNGSYLVLRSVHYSDRRIATVRGSALLLGGEPHRRAQDQKRPRHQKTKESDAFVQRPADGGPGQQSATPRKVV